MKKRLIAGACIALALVPCFALYGCGGNGDGEAAKKLTAQVTATNGTYQNVYARSERNGGMFQTAAKNTASVAEGAGADDAAEPTERFAGVNEMVTLVKSKQTFSFPGAYALNSFVIDLFTYTQIASAIMEKDKSVALTKIYNVDYFAEDGNLSADYYSRLQKHNWTQIKIPEKMSIAGYDAEAGTANISFTARTASNKKNGVAEFEDVDSSMYFVSDDDFGYAQFTYRYTDSVSACNEIGFDYFSMKDKTMLEINMNADFSVKEINNFSGTMLFPHNFSESELTQIQGWLKALAKEFTETKKALEQSNLALAKAAEIGDVETGSAEEEGASATAQTDETEEVFVKQLDETPFKVAFNCAILDKMLAK